MQKRKWFNITYYLKNAQKFPLKSSEARPEVTAHNRHWKDVGSSNISISKKHLKLIKKTQILCKKPRPSTKGYGEAAACGRGMIQRHNPTHIPTKDINTCCPYWKRTQEGRSGSGTRKLCSWVRQLLFPLCFPQMPSYATAKCLPQNHPTTLCHMPHSCVLKPSTSIHHIQHSAVDEVQASKVAIYDVIY